MFPHFALQVFAELHAQQEYNNIIETAQFISQRIPWGQEQPRPGGGEDGGGGSGEEDVIYERVVR